MTTDRYTKPNAEDVPAVDESKKKRDAKALMSAVGPEGGTHLLYPDAIEKARRVVYGSDFVPQKSAREIDIVDKFGSDHPEYEYFLRRRRERELQIDRAKQWVMDTCVVEEIGGYRAVTKKSFELAAFLEPSHPMGSWRTVALDLPVSEPGGSPPHLEQEDNTDKAQRKKRGRPKVHIDIVMQEFFRRWEVGERYPGSGPQNAAWWSEVLHEWYNNKFARTTQTPSKKTIKNRITQQLRICETARLHEVEYTD
jgi:hypothetical protein